MSVMTKSFSFLVIVSSLVSASAFAFDGPNARIIHDLECRSDVGPRRPGFVVNIDRIVTDLRTKLPVIQATVSRDVLKHPGIQVLLQVPVQSRQERRPGAPRIYEGRNFRLEVKMTATPVGGKTPASVVFYSRKTGRVVDEMLCLKVRGM